MPTTTTTVDRSPSGHFSLLHRLLRGYGPLAVFVVTVGLIAALVPSKVPEKVTAATGAAASSGTETETAPTDAAGAPVATVPGQAAASGGTPAARAATAPPGTSGGCPDRKDQVPGDSYSPPCIAFSGVNGGATTKGVTKDEINVAFRVLDEKGFQQTLAELAGASLVDTPETITRTVSALADYFNQRFQFYGRKLKFDFYNGTGSNTKELLGEGRERAVADATKVAEEIKAFADLSGTSEPYGDALADRKVVAFGMPYLSREWHTARRPYAWSLATDCTVLAEEVSSYVLARLAGGNADFAGGDLKGKPRKVAGLAPDNAWYQDCVTTFRNLLKKGNYDVAIAPQYKLDLGQLSTQAANLIPKLKSQGITTILCGCDPIMPVFLSGEANRQGYYPEFINIGVALDDRDLVGQLWQPEFAKHSFGISALDDSAEQPSNQTIAYEAYKTVRPNDEPAFGVDLIYYQMYMLAIGVQMAGPNLTPQTFEAGMFAYPERSGSAGLWGFGPGDYTPQDDVREIYYDPNAVSPYNGKKGRWIDPKPGVRYPKGQFPKGPPPIPQQ